MSDFSILEIMEIISATEEETSTMEETLEETLEVIMAVVEMADRASATTLEVDLAITLEEMEEGSTVETSATMVGNNNNSKTDFIYSSVLNPTRVRSQKGPEALRRG